MIEVVLISAVAVIGLLSFFEPCTIATHTLFGVRAHGERADKRFSEIFNLLVFRTALFVLIIFIFVAAFGKQEWKTISPEIIFTVLAAVYFISRYSYIPIPHVDFSFLLPAKLKKREAIKLGLTLPACTIPLFIIVIGISLTVHTFAFAFLAAIVYSATFTLPTIITAYKGASVKTRKIFGTTAKTTPFITSGLFLITALVFFLSKHDLNPDALKSVLSEPSIGGIVIGFVAGLVFSFNPVSFSAIPVMLAYVTKARRKKQAVKMGAAFLLGMIFIQVLLGVAAALGGEWVQNIMGRFWGLILGPVLIILGLLWPGWIKIQMPWFGVKGKMAVTYWGAFLLGIPFSIAICPFCSPALVVMLTASAAMGSATFGFFLLLAFSLGRGIPVMIGAYSMGRLKSLTNFTEYQRMFEIFAGVVLIFSGLYLLNEYFFIVGY
ncbi:MAG: hypothetical protein GXO87_04300 [Chlorobi bacterium]|nr:hypothetical protein [Chlorobiota bacterium]